MVTNTAGTTTDVSSGKENGECKQDEEVADENLNSRQSSNANLKATQSQQISGASQNDSSSISNTQEDPRENTNANMMAGNSSYNPHIYGNGLPAAPSSNAEFAGPRPMQSGPNYSSSMHMRFPTNQQPPAATPTLNQLLTTPARHPSQYATGYGNQQPQPEFGQSSQQAWPSKVQERGGGDQMKPETNSYPHQQQPYPGSQHPPYPSQYGKYPSPGGSQVPYNQSQQQTSYNNNNMMMPPGQGGGFPASNPSAPTRHPNYSGYPSYGPQPAYYAQRPPQPNYPASNNNVVESHPYYQQQQQPLPDAQQQNAPQMQDKMFPQQKESMMSPNRRTPQPTPSPMNASQPHPGHPSVAHFRGPPSAPASPSVAARGTPLSPASVRSDAPQPQMRPGSVHSEHSNPPAPSPLSGSGTSGYGTFLSHSTRPNYAWKQQQPNLPQHVSPQQQQSSISQQEGVPQGAAGVKPSGPPSVGKPSTSTAQTFNSQSQPSPGFSQTGGSMPCYDQVPQHLMQGYNSASPAPSERRPSRQGSQGSQTPTVPTPEPSTRQGAAAAAAAAMAAAAHTAHSGNMPTMKQQPPGFYPPAQTQRPPQQPNVNAPQQGIDVNQQNMNYPRMSHAGTPGSAPHRMMGPPGMSPQTNQGSYRMPPPGPYPTGYGQPMGPSPQQGHYPGYYSQAGPGDPNHPRGPRPGFHTSPAQQPHTPEEPAPKKPPNRSASQKLNALYEPDEPGRREFVEGLLRYWEEKEVPLKNAPLMGRKTLDLFRLFHVIKERGGMQEVTATKKWSEISSLLGMGTSSTSGFTLKKQYCKYLYGYECKERGIPEPQEALARVNEANRKRKQAHDKEGMAAHQASMMHQNIGGHPYPQYPPNQYPQHYQMPHSNPGYMMQHNQTNAYSQHPGQPNAIGPQSGAPPGLNYPTVRPWQQPGPAPAVSDPGLLGKSEVRVPKPVAQSPTDASVVPPVVDQNQSIRPPVPSAVTVAAANPFNETSTVPQPPTSVPNVPTPYSAQLDNSKQAVPLRTPQDIQRPTPPPRPGMMPNQYPYSNNPIPHPSSLRGQTDIRGTPSPGPRTPYQPSPPMSTRPLTSIPHHLTANSYTGLKRSASDSFGPPRKFMRPDASQSYAGTPSFRPGTDMIRHSFSSPDTPNSAYRPLGAPMGPSPHSRLQVPFEPQRFPRYMSDKMRGHHPYPPGSRFPSLKNRLQRPMVASPIQKYPHDPRPTLKRQLQMPTRSLAHIKREMSLFPPNSVEATQMRLVKFQRKDCNSVGLIEGWRLIMSLKSGLLVESSWALNALNILLYDQRSVAQLRLSQLPGLLDAIVEHYRRFLSEIFDQNSERKSLGLPTCDDNNLLDAVEKDDFCTVGKAKSTRKKRKGSHVPKYKRKNSTYKVKVEQRSDPFLEDNSNKWDTWPKMNLTDDLSHIILTLSQPLLPKNLKVKSKKSLEVQNEIRCVEATLEDVLSIPCSVLAPDVYDIMKSSIPRTEKTSHKNEATEEDVSKKQAKPPQDANSKPTSAAEKHGALKRKLSQSGVNNASRRDSKEELHVDMSNSTPKTKKCKSDDLETVKSDKKHTGDKIDSSESSSAKLDITSKIDHGAKLCNGLQVNFSLLNEQRDLESKRNSNSITNNTSIKSENSTPIDVEKHTPKVTNQSASLEILGLRSRVKQLVETRNVVILEDEVAGSDGCLSDSISGPLMSSKSMFYRRELSNHLLAISNVLRGFSFIPINTDELVKHKQLMKTLSGILLLRHKHKVRKRSDMSSDPPEKKTNSFDSSRSKTISDKPSEEKILHDELKNNKVIHDKPNDKVNCAKVSLRRFSKAKEEKSASELFAPEEPSTPKEETRKNYLFSSTVFVEETDDPVFKDPWWWDCVRNLREDALTFLANVAPSVDLSLYLDDSIPLAMLDGCLHWATCPSSDACDAFSHKPHNQVSAQRLSVEILTKLSIKDSNVDLILATKPFCTLEKLFNFLVCAIGNKRDKVMREFSIVLLSNLSRGDPSAARIIALNGAAISNLISFLEECEEIAMSNRNQTFHQHEINCGTTVFMMAKAAGTLHTMAAVPENRPSFMKHQLRLLSLSMSHFLGHQITAPIASILFTISHTTT